jgi:hypothetical protein
VPGAARTSGDLARAFKAVRRIARYSTLSGIGSMAGGAARPSVDLVLRREANRLHAAPLGSDGGQLPCKLVGGGQSAVDHGAGKRKNTENSVARHAQCEEWRWTERAGSRVGSSGYQSASQRSPYQDVAFGSAVCSCRSNRSSSAGNPILNKAHRHSTAVRGSLALARRRSSPTRLCPDRSFVEHSFHLETRKRVPSY